jgi:hypothetical protein
VGESVLMSSFDGSGISIAARRRLVDRRLGAACIDVTDPLANPETPLLIYVECESLIRARGVPASGLAYLGANGATGEVVRTDGTRSAASAKADI